MSLSDGMNVKSFDEIDRDYAVLPIDTDNLRVADIVALGPETALISCLVPNEKRKPGQAGRLLDLVFYLYDKGQVRKLRANGLERRAPRIVR